MRRQHVDLQVPGHDHWLSLIAYGHYGRPALVFPSEAGRAWDFENNGMLNSVRDLVEGGRVKIYCVDSLDAYSWADSSIPIEERAVRHGLYTQWLVDEAVPWIHRDTDHGTDLLALGCSLGAYHAVHFALQRADLVPLAIGLSGNYDVATWRAWGERGMQRISPTRPTTSRICMATTSPGYVDACRSCWSVARAPGRPTPPDRYRRAVGWRVCCRTRGFVVSSTSGAWTSVTTGRGGGASLRTIYPGSAEPPRLC